MAEPARRSDRRSPPPSRRGPTPSLILETSVVALFHTAVLFSLFLLFTGHNAPGGGFVGGLVAGSAFVLRYVVGGSEEVQRTTPLSSASLVGIGLTVAVATGAASWLLGGEFLESGSVTFEAPLLGTVKVASALAFDIGVYLVVVGVVIGILTTLGHDGDEPEPVEASG